MLSYIDGRSALNQARLAALGINFQDLFFEKTNLVRCAAVRSETQLKINLHTPFAVKHGFVFKETPFNGLLVDYGPQPNGSIIVEFRATLSKAPAGRNPYGLQNSSQLKEWKFSYNKWMAHSIKALEPNFFNLQATACCVIQNPTTLEWHIFMDLSRMDFLAKAPAQEALTLETPEPGPVLLSDANLVQLSKRLAELVEEED